MPDNHEYHRALHKCIIGVDDVSDVASLNADDVSKLEALYDELGVKHPRCDTIKRFPLEYSSGAAFEAKLRAFAEKPLRKGVPSLFQDIEAMSSNTRPMIAAFSSFAYSASMSWNSDPPGWNPAAAC